MLIAKFVMCLYMIAVLYLTSACAGKNQTENDQTHDESAAAAGAPAQASPAPAKIAALDGSASNRLEIFSHSPASGEWRTGSATFQISLPGPGTLILISAALESQTCSPDQFSASFALFDVAPDGALSGMQPVALQQAFRVYEQKTLQLQADAMVKGHCTALSPAAFVFALKFIGQTASDIDGTDDDHQPGPQQPGPQQPGPQQPGPQQPGPQQPGPQQPGPQQPNPPPPSPGCDGTTPPADAPKIYNGKIRLWTTAARAEGCRNSFTWTIREAVRPDPLSRCAFPEVKLDTPQPQFLKLSEAFDDHSRQLAWFLMKSGADASKIANALRTGQTVDLTYDKEACLGENRDWLTIAQPTDLLLFRNDARDFDDCGDFNFAALSRDTNAGDGGFLATYDYRGGGAEQFYYRAVFFLTGLNGDADTNGSSTWSVFNRRTHAWVLPFQNSEVRIGAGGLSGSVEVTEAAALHRLLPQQEHLELVFRPKTTTCDKNAVRTQAVFDAGSLFLTSEGANHFRDLAQPGRSRFALKEADLPASEM
jgi:hypothetical protein